MKPQTLQNLVVMVLLATQLTLAQTKPAVELEGAIVKEQVDGDLKTAIAAYQKIAAETDAPRDVKARALLHLARCYEKLGQQAETVYRQIVRDFGDEPEATQARARLAALKHNDSSQVAAATTTLNKFDMPFRYGAGVTDGHRAMYWNDKGQIIYKDLASKSERIIFRSSFEAKNDTYQFPSHDFSMSGLAIHNGSLDKQQVLAVVRSDGTGYRELANLAPGDIETFYWSWDNRTVLLGRSSPDGTSHLSTISVLDGKIRELLMLKSGTLRAAKFSPDGRFIAYQQKSDQHIFLLPADGGEPVQLYEEPPVSGSEPSLKLLDWTPDGRYLAIAGSHMGKAALQLLPMKDGKVAGEPVLIRYGVLEEGFTTPDGRLIYHSVKPGGSWSIWDLSLDPDGHLRDRKRLDLELGNSRNPWPQLSRDGKLIAYTAAKQDEGESGSDVHIRGLLTAEDRVVYHSPSFAHCVWASQQPKLFCREDNRDKTEVLSIAVDSGDVARLGSLPGTDLEIMPSSDDMALYIFPYGAVMRWEIATQHETELIKPMGSFFWVSPDERWVLHIKTGVDKQIELRTLTDGDWRPFFSTEGTLANENLGFTADGNWLFYTDTNSAGRSSLFRIATAGGQRDRLGDLSLGSGWSILQISSDQRTVIFPVEESPSGTEMWSLENFEPVIPKGAK
jgi:Tol biopolymer transport system component